MKLKFFQNRFLIGVIVCVAALAITASPLLAQDEEGAPPEQGEPAPPGPPHNAQLSPEQLQQLVAPIAL